ncbi:hypothetical protein EYZ11_009967 [Aspergillus tanneri]|uniref:Uncharacterized protein n=1 Tax=Aspergillus tanneri TaxID=1220188 RepID=A0A4S3J6I6_9EURO|nr:hypothetical protein EYZ11_009967 [Aspergillus tanneri]
MYRTRLETYGTVHRHPLDESVLEMGILVISFTRPLTLHRPNQ